MAPNITADAAQCELQPAAEDELQKTRKEAQDRLNDLDDNKIQLVWRNILLFVYLHLSAVYGTYLIFTSAKIQTTIFAIIAYQAGAFGITAGAHRLWSHRSYKAKWPLKLILIIFDTLAFQNSVHEWSRDHRVHHKFSETNADPHNARRGFFFSHVGWLLCRKHELVKEKGKLIDLSDLEADPFVAFQKKHYLAMMALICFILPTVIPMYLWGETFHNAWFVSTLWRYTVTLNVTWLVNSAAHIWGAHPYDKNIHPSENLFVSTFALGEGWHNYHHTFPWDYKASELGQRINFSTWALNQFAKIGWAYDLKFVSDEVVRKRVLRTGDGTHHLHHHGNEIWGWGDKDQTQENIQRATIIHPENDKNS